MDVFNGVGAFGTVFGLVGLAFTAIAVIMIVRILRRAGTTGAALRSGLVAEGRVLDVYQALEGRHDHRLTVRHAIIGFRAANGQDYRIDDSSGQPRIVGDHVPVKYLPGSPDRGVPADARGAGTGGMPAVVPVIILSVFGLIGLFFALIGFGLAGIGFSVGTSTLPTSNFPTGFPSAGG